MNTAVTKAGVITLTVTLIATGAAASVSADSVHAELSNSTKFIEQVAAAGTSSTISSFKDVPTTHWAHNAIEASVANGYFKGYSDGTFRPNAEVTREEFAVLMSRVSNNPVGAGSTVPGIEGKWSQLEIEKAIGQGFINPGQYVGGFNPTQSLTRMEMSTWLVNGLVSKFPEYSKAKADLQDGIIPVAEFYKGNLAKSDYGTVGVAVGTGLLTGSPDGKFGGSNTTSRAEVALLLMRYAAMQDKAPSEFSWLNEMREIGLTGTNMVSKGFTFSHTTKTVYDFSQIRDKEFTVGKGIVSAKIKRLVIVDYNGDSNNPLTKFFMGTKLADPNGRYTNNKSLVLLESELTPTVKLASDKYAMYFQDIGYMVNGESITNAPLLYGWTSMPGAMGWENPAFFAAGKVKGYWVATPFTSKNIGGSGWTTIRIKLPTGEYVSATPPEK